MAIKVKIKNTLNQKELERYFGITSRRETETYKQTGKITIKRGSSSNSKSKNK